MSHYVPHKPRFYIAGCYIPEKEIWLGDFYATQQELLDYTENDVKTVQEFELLMNMAIAQFEYEVWWEGIKRKD